LAVVARYAFATPADARAEARRALAAGLFLELLECTDRDDAGGAAAAQKRLLALGWSVGRVITP
jgi:hypothetical protein